MTQKYIHDGGALIQKYIHDGGELIQKYIHDGGEFDYFVFWLVLTTNAGAVIGCLKLQLLRNHLIPTDDGGARLLMLSHWLSEPEMFSDSLSQCRMFFDWLPEPQYIPFNSSAQCRYC